MQTLAQQQLISRTVEKRVAVVAKAEKDVSRRQAFSLASGLAFLAVGAPSQAKRVAEGDLPIFGNSGSKVLSFISYVGDGFKLDIPSEWQPSKEVEVAGQKLRYEDHFDQVTTLLISKEKSDKGTITGYGTSAQFLSDRSAQLFGQSTWNLPTDAEGGFKSGKVAAASLMEVEEGPDKKTGVPTYFYYVLVRTADDNEGGRHYLIKAAVKNGYLYIARTCSGDKRWIRNQRRNCYAAINSFALV